MDQNPFEDDDVIINASRQHNPHPNVTIRHARNAFHLLVCGALRELELSTSEPDTRHRIVELFDAIVEELHGWEIDDCWANRAEDLIDALRKSTTAQVKVVEVLGEHGFLPA